MCYVFSSINCHEKITVSSSFFRTSVWRRYCWVWYCYGLSVQLTVIYRCSCWMKATWCSCKILVRDSSLLASSMDRYIYRIYGIWVLNGNRSWKCSFAKKVHHMPYKIKVTTSICSRNSKASRQSFTKFLCMLDVAYEHGVTCRPQCRLSRPWLG